MYKNFCIFKNTHKKEGSKSPDYKLSVKKDDKEYVDAGGCWLKDGKSGKFFSCKLNDTFVDNTKNVARKGFVIQLEDSNGNDMPDMPEEEKVDESQIPF